MKSIKKKKIIKKFIYQFFSGLIGAIILGLVGFLVLINYGGNNCDSYPNMTCNCFCCHLFGLRGYESCSQFGLFAGILVGAIIGIILCNLFLRKSKVY